MSIQSNFPNLQPSLLLDFANTKQLDNRVTFTRSTPAVYYDGRTTTMAEQNLLTYSQAFNFWGSEYISTSPDSTTAPDGTTTADTLTPNGGVTNKSLYSNQIFVVLNSIYTWSVYAKKNGSNFVQLSWYAGEFSNCYANFDLNSGTVGTASGCTSTITSVGNGWYRCTMTATCTTASSTSRCYINVITSSTAAQFESYTATTQSIYAWGYQFEQRSSATAYTATTTQPITNYIPVLLTAGGNQPRFDCNPTTGESLGLLIEEQRTNLCTYSAAINSWPTNARVTIDTNSAIAPDGTLSADTVVPTSGLNSHYAQSASATGLSGNYYTGSAYVKPAGWTRFALEVFIGGNDGAVWFDLSAGTIFANSTGYSGTITAVGNGWYRVTVTTPVAVSNTNGTLVCHPIPASITTATTIATGDGYSGTLLWGAQLEVGSFATSYIPTTSASATRTADSASMTGTNFSSWYSQGEGTMYGELSSALTTGFRLLTFSDGTSNNQNWISENSAAIYRNNDYQYYASGFNLGNNGKIAMTYAPNDAQNAVNGTYGSVDGTVNLANNLTTALIGANASLDVGSLTIKKLAFYPQRLSQTNLQALTS